MNQNASAAMSKTRLVHWPAWNRLPREARDTLFLLCVIGWTVLPHVSHLPIWCSLLTLAVLLWRARLAISNAALPSRWVLVIVLLVATGLTLWSFHSLFGREPGVTLAVVLVALKTLELRARRDAFVVFFLGFFIVLTHFFYSQSLGVAVAMLVSLWGLLTALVLAHMPVGQPSLRQASALAARTALLGAPIMALMFVLFPRVGPLWGVPQDGQPKTGLSDSMRMGSVAELAQDDSIAMRVRFYGDKPPSAQLYFRGPVLASFDGTDWRPASANVIMAEQASSRLRVSGAPVSYEVTLEPSRLTALPLLDATPEPPDIIGYQLERLPNLQWRADRPVQDRLRFRVESYPAFQYGPIAYSESLAPYLRLPPDHNPRALAWAQETRRDPQFANASARVLAALLMQQIRTGGFSYTLAPGEYGTDAVDEFWFDRREGFCEHFAAAFVVLMRAMNVPARVVTGYQGVDPIPDSGYWLVRQSSAHAWAEYWQPGAGWIRADPTAAVAPDRISGGRPLIPAPGLVAGAIGSVSPALMAELRAGWESINNRWNQWVLNYARGQQLDLLRNLGFSSPGWDDLALLLVGALSALALGGAFWAWWDRHRIDPWVRQMERLRSVLSDKGLPSDAHEPPRALATRVRHHFGANGEPLAALLDALDRQRYSREARARPDVSLTREFVVRARGLRAA